jgi:hypothetical protein
MPRKSAAKREVKGLVKGEECCLIIASRRGRKVYVPAADGSLVHRGADVGYLDHVKRLFAEGWKKVRLESLAKFDDGTFGLMATVTAWPPDPADRLTDRSHDRPTVPPTRSTSSEASTA